MAQACAAVGMNQPRPEAEAEAEVIREVLMNVVVGMSRKNAEAGQVSVQNIPLPPHLPSITERRLTLGTSPAPS